MGRTSLAEFWARADATKPLNAAFIFAHALLSLVLLVLAVCELFD